MADERREAPPEALAYHCDLVARLKRTEPEVWSWAASLGVADDHAGELKAELLKQTYRLAPESHADVYGCCEQARERLAIEAGVTVYQNQGTGLNAHLRYLPGEAHVVLQGPVLNVLSRDEVTALMGHELAHFRLWSISDGDVYVAARILDHVLSGPGAAASHHETGRLLNLYTELFADRGAAVACGALEPAISTLVKAHTGAGEVDAAAYLRQARELDEADADVSRAWTHPELFLRARALEKWWNGDPDLEDWLRRRLHGPLSLERLDLAGQEAAAELTRRFLALFIAEADLSGETIATLARCYFPDWRGDERPAAYEELAADRIDDSVREYLTFVMLDVALADPDLKEHALAGAARVARRMGAFDGLMKALKREAGLGRRELAELNKRIAKAAA